MAMAISRLGYTVKVDDRGVDDITIDCPAEVVTGAVMYACLGSICFAPTTITPPDDWEQMSARNNPGTDNTTSWIFRKVAGGSEPSSYTWGFADNGKSLAAIVAYNHVNGAATPVVDDDGWVDPAHTVATPSVTPAAGDWLLTYQFGRESPSTGSVKSWTNARAADFEIVDDYNRDESERLGSHALWDSNGPLTAVAQSRSITSSVDMQQVTVHSLVIPAAEGGGGVNVWSGMG